MDENPYKPPVPISPAATEVTGITFGRAILRGVKWGAITGAVLGLIQMIGATLYHANGPGHHLWLNPWWGGVAILLMAGRAATGAFLGAIVGAIVWFVYHPEP